MQLLRLRIGGQCKRWLMALGLCLLFAAASAESSDPSGVLRSRVYKLKHITSQQARDMFTQLTIGKSYNTLTSDVLIVTSDVGADLVKATEVVRVLDQTPPAQIRVLMAASDTAARPSAEVLAARLKTITIGTMTEGPASGSVRPAIVDVVGTNLVGIGAEDVLNEIETALAEWQKENPKPALPSENTPSATPVMIVEPNLPAEPNLVTESKIPTEPKPAVEPNLPAETKPREFVPLTPVEPAPKEAAPEEMPPQFVETPLSDVNVPSVSLPAQEVPSEQAAETAPEEDFLSEGLMKAMADAEEKSQQTEPAPQVPKETLTAEPVPVQAEPLTAPVLPVPQPSSEMDAESNETETAQPTPSEADQLKALQAFIEQVQQEEQGLTQEQPQAETKAAESGVQPQPTTAEQGAGPSHVAQRIDELQAQLAQLRQQITELEKQPAAEKTQPQAKAAQPQETAAPVAKAQESKVQAAEPVQIPPQIAEKELETIVDLPQEVELEALVDLVGKQLGLNYMYDPMILKGQKVQLKINGGKIKVKDTYALLESVMQFKGFIMTRRDQLVTILGKQDMAKAEPVLREPGEPIQPGDIVVSSLFELKHVDTTSAQNMLKSMNLGTAFIPIAEKNTLIVTDYAYRMDRIRQVLEMIDVSGATREYKLRTLKYMKPSDIVGKLKDLVGQLQGVALQISTPPTAAAAPVQTRTVTTRNPQTGQIETKEIPIPTPARAATPATAATPAGEAPKDSVFIDADDRTNRILIIGKTDQIALINELVDVLDVPQYNLKYVREYLIQNVEATDVVNVLNELGLANVSVSAPTAQTGAVPAARTARVATPAVPGAPAAQAAQTDGGDQPYVVVRPASNSLLVNGTAEQHSAVELVIAHVDVVQKDQRTIRQYEIQYVDTQEIIDTMTDLGMIAPQTTGTGAAARSSTTGRGTSAARGTTAVPPGQPAAEGQVAPMALPTAEGGAEVELTAEYPQISVLRATNSLLVYATPRQHDAIALIIAHADRTPETTTTPYVVYALENQNPVELEVVLTKLIQETVEEVGKTSTPESKIQTAPATGGTEGGTPPTLEEQKIRIIPDEKSYSLIVYANKRNQQWISELIKELDEYRPQVLLDLTLVEVSKLDQFQYDLDIISANPDLDFTSGALDYGIGVQDNPPTTSTILTNLNNATDRNYFLEGTVDSGELAGFYANDQIMALLQTMQKKNYGRILNRPKLLVNDNEEGSISLEQVTYREIRTTTIVGTDNPQTSENVDYKDYAAGITMTIKPHISKGDQLRLEITLNRSDFNIQEGDDPALPPNTITSDVTTVVTVPDKNTIILGGLERINQSKGGTKVPILGDIPIVGGLFRSIGNSDDQRKTYIFLQANILRPGEDNLDLKNISQRDRAQFEGMEKEMQEYQNWPGINPKPMKPEKVLEEEDFGIQTEE